MATALDELRVDFGKSGFVGGEKQGKGNSEDCSAMWFAVSGFIVMLLVSRLSRHDHSDSGSFLVVHTSLSQDGFQQGFWDIRKMYRLESFLSF